MEGCRQTVWVALSMPSEKKKIPLRDSPETSRSAGGSSSKGEGEMKIDHFFAELKRRDFDSRPRLKSYAIRYLRRLHRLELVESQPKSQQIH